MDAGDEPYEGSGKPLNDAQKAALLERLKRELEAIQSSYKEIRPNTQNTLTFLRNLPEILRARFGYDDPLSEAALATVGTTPATYSEVRGIFETRAVGEAINKERETTQVALRVLFANAGAGEWFDPEHLESEQRNFVNVVFDPDPPPYPGVDKG